MLRNTQGIVLHTTKFSESSLIAKVFTRELGLRSYLVKGVRGNRRAIGKANLLQPMSHLEMNVYENTRKEIQYIKEMQPARHYNNLRGDGVRMSLLFFMDEVLYKSVREEVPNPGLFDYVVGQLERIDGQLTQSETATLPLDFLIHAAHHLGIEPLDNYSNSEPLFNLKEGRFLSGPSVHTNAPDAEPTYYLDARSSSDLHSCLQYAKHSGSLSAPTLPAVRRHETLNHLLEYYHLHLADFHNFHSHEVFHAVLR